MAARRPTGPRTSSAGNAPRGSCGWSRAIASEGNRHLHQGRFRGALGNPLSDHGANHHDRGGTEAFGLNPVGQVVGQFEKVEKTSAVIERWVNEYLEATQHLDALNEAAAAG